MKFLHLFGKSITPSLHHVRQTPRRTAATDEETARKIDAIESEICAEFNAGAATAQDTPDALLRQHIDEASLLYASRQPDAARDLLLETVARRSASAQEPLAWMMLLELACAAGSQAQFEELALRYAQRFDTSPPQWRGSQPEPAATAVIPAVLTYRGKLSGSAAAALGQLAHMGRAHQALRIDLNGVTTVDDDGCGLLLDALEQWLGEGRQVGLLPSAALAAQLRTQLDDAGESRSDTHRTRHNCWRLLLELLRASGDVTAHDEACAAYSIACEVSPPAPLLPAPAAPHRAADTLVLPAEIAYPVDTLLESLREPATRQSVIVLDCRHLQLIEFNAATPLLAGLARLADGKPVEWRNLSHLVSTLLQLVGGAGRLRIVNRMP